MLDKRCIRQNLSIAAAVATLQALLAQAGNTSRAAFARQVCCKFGFVNARGELQLAHSQKVLRGLHRQGRIALPAPRHGDRGLGRPGTDLGNHPAAAPDLKRTRRLRASPRGRHPCRCPAALPDRVRARRARGDQLRRLSPGSRGPRRVDRLHRVLGLSRLLIRPSMRCHLLASKVFGTILRRLPEDFRQRYGDRPALVETYCDLQQHASTCFRAANWIHLGQTRPAANSTLITSTTSPSRASSSNFSAKTGKQSSIVSSTPALHGPLEGLVGPLTEKSSPGISREIPLTPEIGDPYKMFCGAEPSP